MRDIRFASVKIRDDSDLIVSYRVSRNNAAFRLAVNRALAGLFVQAISRKSMNVGRRLRKTQRVDLSNVHAQWVARMKNSDWISTEVLVWNKASI